VLSGLALFVLSSPGGGIAAELQRRMVGGFSEPWPSVLWIVGALLVVWLPLKRSRLGIAIYAVGSDRNASFLSGVRVAQVRVFAYTVGGFFAGTAGIITTAFTGSGEPRASIGANVTLNSVAAVVLGGVVLSGGVGGLVGPVLAAMCLTLIPAIMLGLGWDPSYAETARGILIILVVMVGGLLQARRKRT
jgi:ribose transport system permease protein